MSAMKRRICILLTLLLVLTVWPAQAFAVGKIDVDRPCSLHIHYQYAGKAIGNVSFSLYKVADADAYERMTLTAAFEPLKQSILGLAELESTPGDDAWRELARTLKSYKAQFAGAKTADGVTDGSGALTFEGLTPGLYLVIGSNKTVGDYTYVIDPFLTFLPALNMDADEWNYDYSLPVEIKAYRYKDSKDVTKIKVIKVWEGDEEADTRPSSVEVELLMDGKAVKSATLNSKNNWRHTWEDLDRSCEWDVRETDVPDDYKVDISQSGDTIVITNTFDEDVPPPGGNPGVEPGGDGPEGDNPGGNDPGNNPGGNNQSGETPAGPNGQGTLPQTGALWWPVLALLFTGCICLIAGADRSRRRNG